MAESTNSQTSATTSRMLAAYVGTVVAAAAVATALILFRFGRPNFWAAGAFWLLAVGADSTKVEVPMGPLGLAVGARRRQPALSAGFLVALTAALATSPATALLVGAGSSLSPRSWRGTLRSTFNAAQSVIYTGAASTIFYLLGGLDRGMGTGVAAAISATIVAVGINTCLVAGAVAIERGWALGRSMQRLLWPTPYTVTLAFPAFLIAVLYRSVGGLGPLAAAFLITPLLVLRKARSAKLELDEARDRTLKAFVRTVELKDPYTRRHSERVAAIAIELHKELGTADRELARRYYGALLHDIGKVAIPAQILTKPGPLSREEFEVVKIHPRLGAEAVEEISFLRSLAAEILGHHERMDGQGYPQGLRGEEIPLNARVLAVADAFEALTSRRPYRPEMSYGAAIREIMGSSGSQHDPAIVAALRRVLEKGSVLPLEPDFVLDAEDGGAHGSSAAHA